MIRNTITDEDIFFREKVHRKNVLRSKIKSLNQDIACSSDCQDIDKLMAEVTQLELELSDLR